MLEGDRVRNLRKSLGLTLEEFGSKIGMKKNSISQIENNKNSLTDKTLISICREFDVSENWLRTGDGEMFVPMSTDEKYKKAAEAIADGDSDLDRIVQRTLIYYYEMDTKSKAALLNYIQTISALLPTKKSLFDEAPEVDDMLKQENHDLTGNTG